MSCLCTTDVPVSLSSGIFLGRPWRECFPTVRDFSGSRHETSWRSRHFWQILTKLYFWHYQSWQWICVLAKRYSLPLTRSTRSRYRWCKVFSTVCNRQNNFWVVGMQLLRLLLAVFSKPPLTFVASKEILVSAQYCFLVSGFCFAPLVLWLVTISLCSFSFAAVSV